MGGDFLTWQRPRAGSLDPTATEIVIKAKEWSEAKNSKTKRLLSPLGGNVQTAPSKKKAKSFLATKRKKKANPLVVGDYEITAHLDAHGGGGAALYLGTHRQTGETVVIKVVKKYGGDDGFYITKKAKSKAFRQLKKEALVMACLQENQNIQDILNKYDNHRILPLLQVVEDENRLCLVMPFAEGGDLFDYISQRRGLDRDEAWRIFAQIVEGLSFAHSRGFIHRDIKPENIFLDGEGNVLIGDWGFGTHWSSFQPKTRACGSPNYVAGEVLREAPYIGPELDVFSLGVVFYACLTGNLPFGRGKGPEYCARVKNGDWSDDPRLTSCERELLDSMFHPDPLFRATLYDISQVLKRRKLRRRKTC